MESTNKLNKNENIKNIGPITYALFKVFDSLNCTSPSYFILNNRRNMHASLKHMNQQEVLDTTIDRAKKVDLYLLCSIGIEVILAVIIPWLRNLQCSIFILIVGIILAIRLIEIIQINVNLSLFDSLAVKDASSFYPHSMASPTRTLINMVLNFMEIVILFGVFYYIIPGGTIVQEKNQLEYFDCFYYSFGVQVVGGFENIYSIGWHKLITIIQVLVAFFFNIVILARVIGLLPGIKSVAEPKSDT